MIIVGIVAGLVYLVLRALAHLAGRAASFFRPPEPNREPEPEPEPEPERSEPAPAAREFNRRLPVKGPRAMV